MTRVYVDQPLQPGTECRLPEAASAHLVRVLRMTVGEHFVLFNGAGGEFAARIASIAKAGVVASLGAHSAIERESPLRTLLLPALVRGERMDYIVQKATELGVHDIQPVLCARSNIRVDADGSERKLEHWRGVAIAACEQCGRNTLPELRAPLALRDAVEAARAAADLRLLLLPGATQSLRQRVDATPAVAIALLTGPEGGFDATEEQLALQSGFTPCRLGPRVLRTETAPLAALAALQSLAGDFR